MTNPALPGWMESGVTVRTDPVSGALLRLMTDAARNLNDAHWGAGGGGQLGEPVNREYARAQAELIADTIGLSMDEYREALIDVITHNRPLSIITRH